MRQLVKYACGDEQVVSLVSRSARTRLETLHTLARSLCPTCQRRSRYAVARQCAEEAGLLPLQAGCLQHLALAEIIRASLWRGLLPPNADAQIHRLLATLFNRCSTASFWLSLRGWAMDRIDATQAGHLLLRLLQPTGKDEPHD